MDYHFEILEIFYKFKNLHFNKILPKDITHGECFAMMKLKEVESTNITFSSLANELQISTPALSRTIKHLIEKGYVKRIEDKIDRRNSFLKLTKKGNDTIKKVKINMKDYSKNIYKKLGEKRFNDFINCLNDLYDISKNEINKIKRED